MPTTARAPVLLETEGPLVEAATAAMEDIWRRPVKVREGGSIAPHRIGGRPRV